MPGFLNPLNGLLALLGQALQHTLQSLAGWGFTQLISALQATTSVAFGSSFSGPWRAMAAVASLLALPLLLIGVTQEVLQGRPLVALQRGLLTPLLVGVTLLAAPVLLGGMLQLTDVMCTGLVSLGIGGPAGFARALDSMQLLLGGAAGDPFTASGIPGPVAMLLLLCVGVLTFVIWIELAVRAALIYLLAVTIPLAAAGLFWRGTLGWARRTVDVLLAVVLSKLVITAVMVLAAASLGAVPAGAARSVGQIATGLALLLLGSLALPMTLRLVPHAADAALAAGTGAMTARRVRSSARTAGTTVAAVAGPTGVGFAAAALAGPSTVLRLAASRSDPARGGIAAASASAAAGGGGGTPGQHGPASAAATPNLNPGTGSSTGADAS